MQRKLTAFLQRAAERPFSYGQSDCCLFLADWWKACHGNDPAHHLRGRYSSEATKDVLVIAERGLQRLVAGLARSAGAKRTGSPTTGDFGLIVLQGKPYGAICIGRMAEAVCWAVRSETGVAFLTNPRILQAWAINDAMAA